MVDKSISPLIKRSLVRERIENSELKNQNSSMRANGKYTPQKRKIVSNKIKDFFNKWFFILILIKTYLLNMFNF